MPALNKLNIIYKIPSSIVEPDHKSTSSLAQTMTPVSYIIRIFVNSSIGPSGRSVQISVKGVWTYEKVVFKAM